MYFLAVYRSRWYHTSDPRSRSWRSESCKNGRFQSLSLSVCM